MPEFFHLNCVTIHSPLSENVGGHCLLIKEGERLILVDTGIGLNDVQFPEERIGKELITLVGYVFDENQTATRQITKLGFKPEQVTDCIITHLDNDHIGGLADFPHARVHLSEEEMQNYTNGNPRYLTPPMAHGPRLHTYPGSADRWLGMEARKLDIPISTALYLVPLPGHTMGHCGVAIETAEGWLLYAGDAYYLREEFTNPLHPVHTLAAMRADDNILRMQSLEKIRTLMNTYPAMKVYSYHDGNEFQMEDVRWQMADFRCQI